MEFDNNYITQNHIWFICTFRYLRIRHIKLVVRGWTSLVLNKGVGYKTERRRGDLKSQRLLHLTSLAVKAIRSGYASSMSYRMK